MADELTADEIRALLKLEPNATCGFVQLTYVSTQSIAAGGLPPPFADARPMGSALYFMVTPTAPVRLHRIRNDQLYHYYLGDPLEVLLLHGGGTTERVVVGPDLRGGERVQLLIPGNTFHTARLTGTPPLVSRCEHRMAGGRAGRRRDRRCREAGSEIPRCCRRSARDQGLHSRELKPQGESGAPIFRACSTIHARYRVSGVTPVSPPQPSLNAGPVDQLTTPTTASAPPISR